MIGLVNLGKSYGARTLFEGTSLELLAGARYGLVGANGSGKTTLLRILSGDEPASDGQVTLPKQARLGVLRQDQFANDSEAILDVAMSGDTLVTSALAEQARLIESGAQPERVAELEDRIASLDGYTLKARASHVLEGLGIPVPQHSKPLWSLSGGFKLRVLLAQVLIGGPDILLLDEPTNHLDILSIRWLEKFLAGYRGCAVVISHDQRFLDNVATHILDVDYQTVTLYPGNYSAFEKSKAETHARKAAEIARAEAAIAEKKAWIERFGAKATKARQAQSRLKQLERIEVDELEQSTRRAPHFHFEQERPSGKDVLEMQGISKSYGEKAVLRNVSLTLRRGERLAVIGPNGLGKSTLLKIVTGKLEADAGKTQLGYEARLGYFAQDHHELLSDPDARVLDVIWDTIPQETTSYVRGRLGNLLFTGQDVEKKVGSLSGGEAARLVFCRIMVQKPNLLVLDEPTNHLDIESIQALIRALQTFEGTVLFVSHDRAFVAALATRILEVTPGGFRAFNGTYAEYLAQSGDDHLDSNAVALRDKQEKSKAQAEKATSSALSWEEQKKRKNRLKQLPNERDRVLAAIESAEARKAAIQAQWGDPTFYEQTAPSKIAELENEEKQLEAQIASWMAEWEALELELEALSNSG
ncbi:MAG TPA: ABC-F family ATP-binding cassette domain-containing protein [Polyangiaceae bacterium]|nr:ABC-F family ATP-binding cassette domain-containing protein [Polyangiaceae bacterium]